MASDQEIIKSYLVSLGADVDVPSFAKMDRVLATSESFVRKSLGAQAGHFATYQIAATTALGSIGASVMGYIAHLANLNQQQGINAMQNGMNIGQYRAMSGALDVMGLSIEDVWNGTAQMQRQFKELYNDQKQMNTMLGPDFEHQMEQVREVTFQIQRLELKAQNFGMLAAHDLLTHMGFGEDGLTKQLARLNDYIMDKMPEWSDEISKDFVPVLNEVWTVLKETGEVVGLLGIGFTNLVGILTGNQALEGETVSFQQFAEAVKDVVGWVGQLLNLMLLTEREALHLGGAVGHGLRSLWDNVKGDHAGAAAEDKMARDSVMAIPGDYQGARARMSALQSGNATSTPASTLGTFLDSSMASKAADAARAASASTGIPANLIFGQWEHETNKFTNRGATDLNNLAGIKKRGGKEYRSFDSVEDFGDYYARLLKSPRYANNGVLAARTPEDFASSLKKGGYFEDKVDNYAKGIRRNSGDLPQVNVSVSVGNITNTSPADIAAAARNGAREALQDHSQRQMAEFGGAYN